MSPAVQALLSGGLTFGVPLAWALRELAGLRRGGGWRPEPAPDPPQKPLPSCLLVLPRERAAPAPKPRVPETV